MCIAAESLLLHVLRTLNISVHILEDSHPTTSGSKPSLPSLSPIKRHGSSAGRTTPMSGDLPPESKGGRGMSPIKNIIHGNLHMFFMFVVPHWCFVLILTTEHLLDSR